MNDEFAAGAVEMPPSWIVGEGEEDQYSDMQSAPRGQPARSTRAGRRGSANGADRSFGWSQACIGQLRTCPQCTLCTGSTAGGTAIGVVGGGGRWCEQRSIIVPCWMHFFVLFFAYFNS